ncbi:MAG: DUF4332 domain-containing protein, partial [Myxococcota bacterium]|nr:DUF4332 domain-containing protein [Myxococcota bacterium]
MNNRTSFGKRGVFALALLVAIGGLFSSAALGSHYRLPADGLVTPKEHRMLEANGLSTTEKVLDYAATDRGRKKLSKYSKIPVPRIVEIVTQCDLLRVDGVGPSMARILQAAGIRDTAPLSAAEGKALRKAMAKANRGGKFAKVLPDVKTITSWITQAKRMPRLLQGLP